ncbi:hypothetical protein LAZ67_3006306 [Cordylochernes scorpioides]|uniref:CCHC-type domain-containing protein n=1 Tax=Cordylochernes scorpioides TaxID=51811 RepID=A0ABY6KB25_9ARAC|nr:hypothetical protein LAZ67_3006306 [Cordylochernes scorpioides]
MIPRCRTVGRSTIATGLDLSPRRRHTRTRRLSLDKQKRDSSENTTLCHSVIHVDLARHHSKRWRLFGGVNGSLLSGRHECKPLATNRREMVLKSEKLKLRKGLLKKVKKLKLRKILLKLKKVKELKLRKNQLKKVKGLKLRKSRLRKGEKADVEKNGSRGIRAQRLVCSYPITEDNYPKVIQALKDIFGDKNLLVEHYIRGLLKLVVSNARKENIPLDEIYDDLTAHLKNLESLGVNTEMAGVFLYPLVESSLPLDIIQVWQKNPAVDYGIKEEEAENGDNAFKRKCIFCQRDNHLTRKCFVASRLTPSERDQKVRKARVCFKCIKGNHLKRECRADIKCRNFRKDLDILCNKIALKQGGNNSFKGEKSEVIHERNTTCTGVNMSARTCANNILLMTSVAKLKGAKKTKEIKVLFDAGTSKNLLLGEAFNGKYVLKLGILPIKLMIPPLPRGRLLYKLKRKKIYIHLSIFRNEEIDILIGSDYFGQLLTGKVVHLGEDLTAGETKLEWTLMGQSPVVCKEDKVQIALNMLVARNNLKDLWELDVLIPSKLSQKKRRETELREHFIKNIKRDEDQRYSVALPWKFERNNIPSNLEIAQRRLEACTSKLRKEKRVKDYSTSLQ